MDTKRVARLENLADDTLSLILETERLRKLNLDTATRDAKITSNVQELSRGLQALDEVLRDNEDSGKFTSAELKEQEDTLIDLMKRLESLQETVGHAKGDTSEVLSRQRRRSLLDGAPGSNSLAINVDDPHRQPVDESVDNVQLVLLQQQTFAEQDRSVEELGRSVRRQRELGLSINNELETHLELLDETDEAADRTAGRLNIAQRKLDDFRRTAKKHRTCYSMLVLVLVLIITVGILRIII